MPTPATSAEARIHSIDLLRGLVIVIMALDHTRDFFHINSFQPEDLTQTHGFLFFTRWITHFCAPVFLFLSGLSAFLHGTRSGLSKNGLAKFLALRGVWLIFVELVIINFAWQFDYDFLFGQVIWAIGVSMIALAALIYLPWRVILGISLVMIAGHNLLDPITPAQLGGFGWVWKILHEGGWVAFPEGAPTTGFYAAYPVVPWIGVMSLGYASGKLFQLEAARRDKLLMIGGAAIFAAFIALRFSNLYGDASPWSVQERGPVMTLVSFLNVTKYPPSLLFLLMTLGPALALMPFFERMRGPIAAFFTVYGKVPFFFYILHFFLIHLLALLWFGITASAWNYDIYTNATFPDVEPSLVRVYIATAVVVGLLYLPCRWFGDFKKRHRDWPWLSYF